MRRAYIAGYAVRADRQTVVVTPRMSDGINENDDWQSREDEGLTR